MEDTIINIYSDGGSRGNPGPAAAGYLIYLQKANSKEVIKKNKFLGIATNNEAEHIAIQLALSDFLLLNQTPKTLFCYLDSELVVRQLQGVYRIKNQRLFIITRKTFQIIEKIGDLGVGINFVSIPRNQNKEADLLVNMALDENL